MKLKLHFGKLKSLRSNLFFALLLVLFTQNSIASNWYVDDSSTVGNIYNLTSSPFVSGSDTTGDGTALKPYATLTKAYSMASSGDLIYVDSGVYISIGTIAFNKANIQIIGAGASNTIFQSGSVSGTVRWGVITASNLQFKGIQITRYDCASDGIALTITSGTGIVFDQDIIYSNVGSGGQGAIFIDGATTSVTIKNSTIPCNRVASALYGGAMKINNATVLIENCSLSNNVISGLSGGALLVQGSSANVTITKSTFDDNGAEAGGAIAHAGGTLVITNSCFNNNNTSGGSSLLGGGAILINPSTTSNVSISNCTFTNNSTSLASSDGGAITITNSSSITSTVVVSTCSFTTNSSADKGDDIYFDNFSSGVHNITFKNCTFNTIYTGTKVNLYNNDMPAASIKFEGLSTPTGTGGCGDIVATPNGVSITKPEMTGNYTETTSNVPTSLASTTCNDRFSGICGTSTATFTCLSTNVWGDVSTTASDADVVTFNKGANISVAITTATYASSKITFTKTMHGLLVGDWIVIEGFTPVAYNGYYKVTDIATNTFKVAKTSNPGTVTTLGTYTKGTPVGWSRKTIPTVDEHVIIDYDYNTTTYGNIDACMLTVKSGKILVTDNDDKNTLGTDTRGTYVYVLNSIINNGTINVNSNGNLIQVNHPLDLNGDAIITPTITVNKNTGNKIRWDYVYWSKPVIDNILSNFSAFDIKYFWNPDYCDSGVDFSYLGWRALTGEPTIGTGFITRVSTSAGTVPTPISLNMSGVSNNGDVSATIKYYDGNDQAFRNFTLLGNPYPGAIKFEDFYNDNKAKIYGTVYLWTSNTPYPGSGLYSQPDYASFNLTGGVLGATTQSPSATVPNGYIASGQGFMVRPKLNGTVLFKNTHRTKEIPSNNQFFRTTQTERKNRFWIRITNSENRFNEQLIGYIPEATNGFDEAYDGLINTFSSIKFYSFIGSQKLIIQGKGEFNKNDVVNIGYSNSITANSQLKISLSNAEGIFETSQKIYLHDKELNIYHNLTDQPYFFTGTVEMDNRFEIVYKRKNSDDNDDDYHKNNDSLEKNKIVVNAYFDNLGMQINASEVMRSILLYDITGKLILEKEINHTTFTNQSQIEIGIYILKIIMADNSSRVIKVNKK